jgi:hypothetical protein
MRILYLSLVIFLFSGCASMHKTSISSGNELISQYINDIYIKGKISKSPLIVIDGNVFKYSKFRRTYKTLSKNEIREIRYLEKNSEAAIDIFGNLGKTGVIIIATTSLKIPKVLYLLDGYEISEAEFTKILRNKDIYSFEMIDNKDDIKKYTPENYDFVWIAKSKN